MEILLGMVGLVGVALLFASWAVRQIDAGERGWR